MRQTDRQRVRQRDRQTERQTDRQTVFNQLTPVCSVPSVPPAWSQGDPRKVIYPTDSRGQFCGHAGTPLE